MRSVNPQVFIDAAYAEHCSPDAAWSWLEARDPAPRVGQVVRFLDAPEGREAPEIALMKREHPLIDLALAQFGSTTLVIRQVYLRGGAGIKCAALRNPFALGREITQRGWMREEDVQLLVSAGWSSEFHAFCENRHLGDQVYQDLLLRRGLFSGLDDTTYAFSLRQLGKNPRLTTPYRADYYDGWDEHSYEKVFDAAWSLAGILPAHEDWAEVLHELLRDCVHPTNRRDVDALLARWRIESEEEARKSYGCGSIWLRALLADLLGADERLLASDDPAVRASFYRRFDPTRLPNWPDRLKADGERNYIQAVRNERLWRDPRERERLASLAWKLPDPNSDMVYPNDFRAFEARYREQHPEWFTDEVVSDSGVEELEC